MPLGDRQGIVPHLGQKARPDQNYLGKTENCHPPNPAVHATCRADLPSRVRPRNPAPALGSLPYFQAFVTRHPASPAPRPCALAPSTPEFDPSSGTDHSSTTPSPLVLDRGCPWGCHWVRQIAPIHGCNHPWHAVNLPSAERSLRH